METHKMRAGKQSLYFHDPVYILAESSAVGKKEGEGPLGSYFDRIEEDDMCGQKTWEDAESHLMEQAVELALKKAGKSAADVRYLFAGDLLGQLIASTFGSEKFQIPMFGLYGACSTMGESISLASMSIAGGFAESALAVTSSHFGSAEKQFRFPTAYANQKPLSSTWTVTGSGAVLLGRRKRDKGEGAEIGVTGITTGRIVDFGLKDNMNMGACMAPAAFDTIQANLKDFMREPEDYDQIITGDLGQVGRGILFDLLKAEGIDISGFYTDCGMEIFDPAHQDVHSGGSGCGCAAVTLTGMILRKMRREEWKKVLFLPTGALLSTVSFNEGNPVPGICHGVVLEVV